ncbi:MAG: hypothetical protein Q8Q86_02255, partial [Candidatus Daviesbacteria bacterium]|nr:hypothetical protein [Candidatus Daviesbacteria bacterium]
YRELTSDYRNQIHPIHHLNALFQVLGRIWYIKAPSNNSDEVITSCSSTSRIGNPKTIGISRRYNPPLLLSLIGSAIVLLFLINKKTWKKENSTLLALFIITITLSFLLFPGGAFEYYLLGLFPLLIFLPGILTIYFPKLKPLIITGVFIAVTLGISTVISNKPDFGLEAKQSLIKQVSMVIGSDSFELKQTGLCHFYEGWRYLFVLNGKRPERSDSDGGLGWLYQSEITQNPVKYTVILSESRVPVTFDTQNAQIFHSGGFGAYIFRNN